jgi:putative ABC transport system ATP-binding protein
VATVNIVEAYGLARVYLGDVEVWAVNEVDLIVRRGEIVAILGPAGAGKTTLLNLIGGYDPPSMGRVIVDGVSVTNIQGNELADFRRERVGHVPQVVRMIPSLSVLRNVTLPLLPYARQVDFDVEARARELLVALGLGGREGQYPSALADGDLERAAIARALINHPPLLLLDEPSASLARDADGAVLNLLDRLNRDVNLSVILATRDQAVAEVADRVVRMDKGVLKA